MTLSSRQPLAIIGAGIAGLSCAQALVQAGYPVHLYDKSRGPSGRMSTRRGTDATYDWQCDHGAQYFTASDPAFIEQVANWQQAGVAALWQGRITSLGNDGSGTAGIGTAGIGTSGIGTTGSSTPPLRYVGLPRMTTPAAHMIQRLMQPPAPQQPAELRLQTTIQALHADARGWRLSSVEHGLLPQDYQALLLAMPAPQAATLLANVCPEGRAIATRASMYACWTVMVRFDQPLELDWDGAFVNSGPLRWVARDSSKPGRSGPETWVLQANAAWSADHLEDTAEHVQQTLLQAFAGLGCPLPDRLQATAHRWRYAGMEPALQMGCWWRPEQGIGLCGDWLHLGKVEGAWLSGHALAHQVMATLGAADTP